MQPIRVVGDARVGEARGEAREEVFVLVEDIIS